MSKNEFTMQRILSYRRSVENQIQGEYARARDRAGQEEAKLLALETQKEAYAAQLPNRGNALSLSEYYQFLTELVAAVEGQTQKLSAARRQADRQQERLMLARQEKKALENLKDRYDSRRRREFDHREQKELDDLGLIYRRPKDGLP